MGVASLVLGIISLIIGFIPLCGSIAFLPAVVGLILGIVAIVKNAKANQPKAMSIAGTILSGIAIVVISFWIFVASAAVNEAAKEIENNGTEALEALSQLASSLEEIE